MTGRRIVALTGAGISAPSGLPTYRGVGCDPSEVHPTSLTDLQQRPETVWTYFTGLRAAVRGSRPNPAHEAIVDLARHHDVLVTTQNVDDLHERAGSATVLHLHGELFRTRCSDPFCDLPAFDDLAGPTSRRTSGPTSGPSSGPTSGPGEVPVPKCPRCGAILRPDVVLFGEPLPRDVKRATDAAVAEADLLLVLGTTLSVSTAVNVTRWARDCGVPRVWLTRRPDPDARLLFNKVVDADIVGALPGLLADLGLTGSPSGYR